MKPTPGQLAGEHGTCDTMKVRMIADGTECAINSHDFDAALHEPVDAAPKKPAKKEK